MMPANNSMQRTALRAAADAERWAAGMENLPGGPVQSSRDSVVNVAVSTLTRGESGQASRLLARAFAEDPIITHFLYDRVRRRIAFPAFFHAVIEETRARRS